MTRVLKTYPVLSQPKAILFDWDNTLADTWPTIYQAMHHTFETFGKTPWTLEETKQNVHRSMKDAFPIIFGNQAEDAGKIYQSYFRAHHLEELLPLPNAESVLDYLHDTSIFLSVVSNKTGINLRKEIDHLQWGHYFDSIVGASDAARDKPAPDPVHKALHGSGIEPGEHVWFIGDSITDMECAHNTGCLPLYLGEETEATKKLFEHCSPKHYIQDHVTLLSLLRSMMLV